MICILICNRAMVVEKDEAVHNIASNVYAAVFRSVPKTNASDYQTYLQNELDTLNSQGPSLAGDPLLSKLNTLELAREILLLVRCMYKSLTK